MAVRRFLAEVGTKVEKLWALPPASGDSFFVYRERSVAV